MNRPYLPATVYDPAAGPGYRVAARAAPVCPPETILPITGPGFETIRNTGTAERNIVHLTHHDGIDVTMKADSVEELVRQPVSLMPADLAASVTVDELVDLVAWLETLKN